MFRRKRSAEDFAEEIKTHLELEADELQSERLERGRGALEGAARVRQRARGAGAVLPERPMGGPGQAVARSSIRLALAAPEPRVCSTAILTLALGIGANTAVFSVMNAVLLRSLPVTDPDRLVYLRTSNPPRGTGTIDSNETFSYPVYDALRQQGGALSPLMAYVPLSGSKVAVRYGAEPEEAEGDMVSGTFFSGLGVKLPRGRGFSEQDETNHAPIAVISYNYWTRRFARNPDVLGKTLYVNGVPITIVGVAAEGFEGVEGGGSTDFWIPLQSRPELNAWGNPLEDGKNYIANPTWWCLRLIGRLAPGVTRAQAVAQLQPVFQTSGLCRAGHADGGREAAGPEPGRCQEFPRIQRAVRQSAAHVDGDGGAGAADCADQCGDAADGAEWGAAARVFRAPGAGCRARRVAAAAAGGEFDPGDGGRRAGLGLCRDGDASAGQMGAD